MYAPILAKILKEESEERRNQWEDLEKIKTLCGHRFILLSVNPNGRKFVYYEGLTELECLGLIEQAKKVFLNREIPTFIGEIREA